MLFRHDKKMGVRRPVMVFIWSERSGRSRPPSKNVAKQPPPKKCREASTTKKCHKQRHKGAMLCLSSPHKKCQSSPPLDKCCKAAPLKKYHKATTTKYFTAAPLEISLQAPPDIETITVEDVRNLALLPHQVTVFIRPKQICVKYGS